MFTYQACAPVLPPVPAATGAPDLIGVLEEIERDALKAIQTIANGQALNGRAALQRIAYKAQDGSRWGKDPSGGPRLITTTA